MAVSLVHLARDAETILGSTATKLDQVNTTFKYAQLLPLKLPADEQIRNLVVYFNLG